MTKSVPSVKLEDLNVGALGLKDWASLTPNQFKERMEDMNWMVDMLYCARVLNGLTHLDWEVAKHYTFREYMEEAKRHASVA